MLPNEYTVFQIALVTAIDGTRPLTDAIPDLCHVGLLLSVFKLLGYVLLLFM